MSLVPLLLNILDDESMLSPGGLHHFGLGLHPREFEEPLLRHTLLPGIYSRPFSTLRRSRTRPQKEYGSVAAPTIGKDGFQVSLDVEHFAPNELTVKTIDNTVVVEGKHEEKEDDHGQIYRHFIRRYQLPKECNVNNVVSHLSSDGVLTLRAPSCEQIESNERTIPIQQTGPAHLSVKQNPQLEKKSEEMSP